MSLSRAYSHWPHHFGTYLEPVTRSGRSPYGACRAESLPDEVFRGAAAGIRYHPLPAFVGKVAAAELPGLWDVADESFSL